MFEGSENRICGQRGESVAVISESFQREAVAGGKRMCACDPVWIPGPDRPGVHEVHFRGS